MQNLAAETPLKCSYTISFLPVTYSQMIYFFHQTLVSFLSALSKKMRKYANFSEVWIGLTGIIISNNPGIYYISLKDFCLKYIDELGFTSSYHRTLPFYLNSLSSMLSSMLYCTPSISACQL